MTQQLTNIMNEIGKVIAGKEDVTRRILRTIIADGHILLDDVPGVGKTSLALALSNAVGFRCRRIQFTPDVMPSDIVGFSVYDRESGSFVYRPGVVHQTNLLLGDEINRTSSKTQAALLETMEERQVTVDGQTYPLADPFLVIATENHVGAAGTQLLPYAQMDRFMVRLTVGQPDREALVRMLRDRQQNDPMETVQCVATVEDMLRMQHEVCALTAKDAVLDYIARLVLASQEHSMLEVGISPRGALFLERSARAEAYMDGRDYVTGADVQAVFDDVCQHRVIVRRQYAQRIAAADVLKELLRTVETPDRRM